MAARRRSDAAGWLRRTVGVVIGKDLPEQPSEEEFRLGLRNGIILCYAFNNVYPGTIPKVCLSEERELVVVITHPFACYVIWPIKPLVIQVIEAPADAALPTDGAALSAFQYFENVRNFLVALEEKGLPTFEASDLEKVRVVKLQLIEGYGIFPLYSLRDNKIRCF